MGSRSEKKQPGALVGEKSQTVFSANWKLDVMLLKNLQMLDVSKHRVGHRIAMDQRVINKRFQTKLYRSKITHARMTNNTELLRELIHRDNFTFNTSVGGQDEKYSVKISPKDTPNQEEVVSKDTLKYGHGKGVRPAATPVVVVELNSDKTKSVTAVYKPGSTNGLGSKRPSSSVSIATKSINRRPATAVAARSKKDPQPASQNFEESQVTESSPNHQTPQRLTNEMKKVRPKTAMPGLSKTSCASQSDKRDVTRRNSHLLSVPSPDGQNLSQTPEQPRPTSATVRRRSPQGKAKHAMPSIFGEDKRPTLLDINRERLVCANFPNRVKNFAGTLKGLQTDPDQTVDYYTLRLMENLQSAGRKGPRVFIESDDERRDAQRSIGNLSALNMTFGDVKKLDSSGEMQTGGLPVRARLSAWEADVDTDDNNNER